MLWCKFDIIFPEPLLMKLHNSIWYYQATHSNYHLQESNSHDGVSYSENTRVCVNWHDTVLLDCTTGEAKSANQ